MIGESRPSLALPDVPMVTPCWMMQLLPITERGPMTTPVGWKRTSPGPIWAFHAMSVPVTRWFSCLMAYPALGIREPAI